MVKVSVSNVYDILKTVCDPEIPVLSILDLGIVRDVKFNDYSLNITITPTYTGCPAMHMIEANILAALKNEGFENVNIITTLSPPWTTDWLTDSGKQKLKEYGIAPPQTTKRIETLLDDQDIICPRCNSLNTNKLSDFGSTACKAMYQCKDCLEPFDYFKCH